MSQQTRSRPSNPFYQLLSATAFSSLHYPAIRIQSMLQTYYGYSSINPELKLRGLLSSANHAIGDTMKGLFRGLSFYASYNVVKTLVFSFYGKFMGFSTFENGVQGFMHSAVATFLATASAYPFELMQIRSASLINSTNPTQVLNYQDTVKTFAHSSNWIGYPLAYSRYMILFSTINMYVSGWNPIIPSLIALSGVPLDVVRRNLVMIQWEKGLPYKNALECTKYLVETNGYRSLFRGIILYPEIYLLSVMILSRKNN